MSMMVNQDEFNVLARKVDSLDAGVRYLTGQLQVAADERAAIRADMHRRFDDVDRKLNAILDALAS